ncbi:hypothetical protein GCM10009099_39170 [Caenispirillum bisanense]
MAGLEGGTLGFDTVTAQHIPTAWGQEASAADLIGAAIEAAESWLFDAARSTGTAGHDMADLAPTAAQAITVYSKRKMLNELWNRCWHEGWQVQVDEKGRYCWWPIDESSERTKFAWRRCFEDKLINWPSLLSWRHLTPSQRRRLARKRSVVAIGDGRIKTRHIPYLSKNMPAYVYEKYMLQGSYVSDFMNSPFPVAPHISVDLLLEAWHVVLDIANLLLPAPPHSTSSLSPDEARRLALSINRATVERAISRALHVSPELSREIAMFLTFTSQTGGKRKVKGNKGLWAAPLIDVPGTDDVLLALPVLTTSITQRRAEAWLEKGGINDDNPAAARGDRYEVIYRSKITRALAENGTFTTASCAPSGVAATASFDEQVDLVVAFGGLCLVGEVKFFLMPLAPHETKRFENKLRRAALQVKRKSDALRERPDVIAGALGIEHTAASALTLLPIIITNQHYGCSTSVEGVLVVEADLLLNYLRSGSAHNNIFALCRNNVAIDRECEELYATEKEAAEKFENHMSAPYMLTRILNRVGWRESYIPTLAHGVTISATPVLEDLSGYERIRAVMLREKLS